MKNKRKMYGIIIYYRDGTVKHEDYFHEYGRTQKIKKLKKLYENNEIKGYSQYEFLKDLE